MSTEKSYVTLEHRAPLSRVAAALYWLSYSLCYLGLLVLLSRLYA